MFVDSAAAAAVVRGESSRFTRKEYVCCCNSERLGCQSVSAWWFQRQTDTSSLIWHESLLEGKIGNRSIITFVIIDSSSSSKVFLRMKQDKGFLFEN